MNIEIRTCVHKPHVIRQEIIVTEPEDYMRESVKSFYSQVIDTKDKQIRDALIALGWTPPREG